jgi:hypothetical protein
MESFWKFKFTEENGSHSEMEISGCDRSTLAPRRPPPGQRRVFSMPTSNAVEVLPTLYLICYKTYHMY